MKQMTKFVMAALAATALLPAAAQDSRNQGYLVDTNGNIVMTTNTGMCVRDGDWTPARSVEPCDPRARPAAAAVPAAAPALAAAPAPAPAFVAPAPAPTMTRRANFSADALFAFDKSDLKPEGKAMLDGLVRDLEGARYDTIVVTGHTDRFGSDDYNQHLSERRSQAVKGYLTSKGIPADRVRADARGETLPVTAAGDCAGARSARVIACLQPDRRVDVEVTGIMAPTVGAR